MHRSPVAVGVRPAGRPGAGVAVEADPPASPVGVTSLASLLVRRPELARLDDEALLLRLARNTACGHLLRQRVAVALVDAERLLDVMIADGRAVVLDLTDPSPAPGVLAVRRPAAVGDMAGARHLARRLASLASLR